MARKQFLKRYILDSNGFILNQDGDMLQTYIDEDKDVFSIIKDVRWYFNDLIDGYTKPNFRYIKQMKKTGKWKTYVTSTAVKIKDNELFDCEYKAAEYANILIGKYGLDRVPNAVPILIEDLYYETFIPGYGQRYVVNSSGAVISYVDRENPIIMKPSINSSGYKILSLCFNKKQSSKSIHRLVAEAFVDNTDNKPEVNHINGNKLDNHISNLEWVTGSENMQHASANGLIPDSSCCAVGVKSGKTSNYNNVSWSNSRSKWQAVIKHNNKYLGGKYFEYESEAAQYVNYLIHKHGLNRPLNEIS